MSNGLEREFPEVAWPAVPPIGPRGMRPGAVRSCIGRGCELHSRAIRDGVRSGPDAIARALLAVIMICRRSGHGSGKRPSARGSWASSGQGA